MRVLLVACAVVVLGALMVQSGAKNFGKRSAPSSGLCREPLLRT